MKVLSVTMIIDEKTKSFTADEYAETISSAIVDNLDVDIFDGNVNLFDIEKARLT